MPPQDPEQARWYAVQVQPHEAALRAYLRAQFPALPDVDNLVQECLVRVLRARERGRVDRPKAFLFTTGRNLALDLVRRQKIVSFEPITEISAPSVFRGNDDVAETVSRQQEFELLTQAIQSLPERCRQVITLRVAYGLSQREIAARLRITENTVEKQMAKGIRRCGEFFARHGLP